MVGRNPPNLFWVRDSIEVSLTGGYQSSRTTIGRFLMLNDTMDQESYFLGLTARGFGFDAHVDYFGGLISIVGTPTWETSDYILDPLKVLNANLDYSRTFGPLKLKAGLALLHPSYTSMLFGYAKDGAGPAAAALTSTAASLRVDYKPIDILRFIAGGRLDYYSSLERKWKPSFQLSAVAHPNKNGRARLIYGHAFRTPFLFGTQSDTDIPNPFTVGQNLGVDGLRFIGNKGLQTFVLDSIELGYRHKLASVVYLDAQVFPAAFHAPADEAARSRASLRQPGVTRSLSLRTALGRAVSLAVTLAKDGKSWKQIKMGGCPFASTGRPDLLALDEGPILYNAMDGIRYTLDQGAHWSSLGDLATNYYPRSVQTFSGHVMIFSHVGHDDPYGAVDQSIQLLQFDVTDMPLPGALIIMTPDTQPNPWEIQCQQDLAAQRAHYTALRGEVLAQFGF